MRSTKLLIDGYNLLFQSQLVGRGQGWLEKARKRLIVELTKSLTEAERRETTLVFDASGRSDASARVDAFARGDRPAVSPTVNEIEVVYASEHAEADDLLEELIRRAPQPKLLRVVSSDQRIRRCARARRAESLDSEAFLQEMETRQSRTRGSRQSEPSGAEPGYGLSADGSADGIDDGPANLSESEVDYWLREFGQGDGI